MGGMTMDFPDTWEEFEESYGFTDTKQLYTNGGRLIPSFRVEQWLDHIKTPEGEWFIDGEYINCSHCKKERWSNEAPIADLVKGFRHCPNCGARMKGAKLWQDILTSMRETEPRHLR